MGTQYFGDPTNYPDAMTLPDEGDGPGIKAADLAPGLEGTADRMSWLKEDVGHLGALNFRAPVAVTGNPLLRWAIYVPYSRKWFVFGDDVKVFQSTNGCTAWGSNTDSAGAGTEDLRVADYDDSGRVLVTHNATGVVHHLASAAAPTTWTAVTVVAGTMVSKPHVVYSPAAARWCWAAVDNVGTGATKIYTSTDRTTWTVGGSAGFPAFGAASEMCLGVNKSSGRLVLMRHDVVAGASNLHMSTSDDGGQTWTLRASKPTSGFVDGFSLGTSLAVCSLTHHPDRGEWLLMLGDTSTPYTEAWTSRDEGVTWTIKAALTSHAILHPAPIKAGWVATTTGGDLVYSVDGAVTWRFAGYIVGPLSAGVFGSVEHGQILSFSNDATDGTTTRFGMVTGAVGATLT